MSAPTILIVDDEEKIREILRLYFIKEGFTVVEAGNGIEAIREVEQLKPDVIILDIMMPV
ncbi:Transcriptional regulatory protein WalR [Sporomusa carbonis]|uniref:response regulator n=1 Tax=Sporomusa carbonis TaxID=3076075 RepID=UPI003A62AB10